MTRKPNILLIVLDSVRRDHVSCYGYERPTTPFIDGLAASGVRFDAAYAASCWTIPSHASLFTGLYPSAHRTDLDNQVFDDDVETFAELLGERGYRSASVSCNGFIGPYTGLTRGFDTAVDVNHRPGDSDGKIKRALARVQQQTRRWTQKDRGAERATRLATQWLSEQSTDDPFLLFLNFMDCHLPYALRGPERYRFVAPEDRERVDAVPMDPFAHVAGERTYSEQETRDLEALYDGALRYLDDHVSRLCEWLARQGRLEDTVVIITSDHGESFGEHGLFDHQYSLHEPLIRVPLVVAGPGFEGSEAGDGRLVQLTDLMPTLLDLSGTGQDPVGNDLGGHSLMGSDQRDWVFAEYLVPNLNAIERRFPKADTRLLDRPLRMASDGRHKLVVDRTGASLLYDLIEDPAETRDLSEARPDVVDRCRDALEAALGPWPDKGIIRATEAPTELQERLKALGYL